MADRNMYGFRPDRCCADAIEHCFGRLARRSSAPWILEGDIKSCFDKISHSWLLENTMVDKSILNKWLKAGYVEDKIFYQTKEGTAQGGLISPCLLVNVLTGLEAAVKAVVNKSDKVHVCAYADDFVITGASQEVLENKVKPAVKTFLIERGLTLSETKTKITHITEGFDFLGFNIRKYKGKLLIKPAKASIKRFLNNLREFIRNSVGWNAGNLIQQLNPKIRGWCNYYRHVVASETFSKIDDRVFKALMRWIKHRHPEKNTYWRVQKYFRQVGIRQWVFHARVLGKEGKSQILDLFAASKIPIKRHVKIRGEATPYNPVFNDYFRERRLKRLAKTAALGSLGQLDKDGLKMARAV